MSSVSRAPSQLPSNVAYFVTLCDNSGNSTKAFYPWQLAKALKSDNGEYVLSSTGSVINTSNADEFVESIPSDCLPRWSEGVQLRDLGKTLYIEENFQNVYIYKLVQNVDGEHTGGVPTNREHGTKTFWALVWAADGDDDDVCLVRTGY